MELNFNKLVYLTLLFFFTTPVFVYGNCEQGRGGYHTIAGYLNEDMELSHSYKLFSFFSSDSYIFLSKLPLSVIADSTYNAFSTISNSGSLNTARGLFYSGKRCSIENSWHIIADGNQVTYRIKNCFLRELRNNAPIMLFDLNTKNLMLPSRLAVKEITPEGDLLQVIKKKLNKIPFKLTPTYTVNKGERNVEFIKHLSVDKNGTFYTVSKVTLQNQSLSFTEWKKVNNSSKQITTDVTKISFYVATLTTKDGIVWYIADSGQAYCGRSEVSEKIERKHDGFYIGDPLFISESFDLNNDGTLDFFRFKDKISLYYVDLLKSLTVVYRYGSNFRKVEWNQNYLKY